MCSITSLCLPEMFQMDIVKKEGRMCSPNLYDRVKKLLVSYEWSDCCFSLCGKEIKAHKLILGISSPVFEAMFYGPLSTNETVVIADIDPEIFQLLLNFIYTDKVELSSVEDAFELIYASKKYLLDQLEDICVQYIEANMSIDNVITILNYPDVIHSDDLYNSALRLFCEHASYLLPEYKNQITLSTMKKILECDKINITEVDIIQSVFDWVSFYCVQNNIPDSKESKRDFLIKNGLFQLIRFNLIGGCLWAIENNVLLPSDIELATKIDEELDEDTISPNVFTSDGVESFMSINTNPRSILKIKCNLCMRNALKSVKPIIIDGNNHVVYTRLKASKSLFITTLCVPTRVAPLLSFGGNSVRTYDDQIRVTIVSESDNTSHTSSYALVSLNYDSMTDIDLIEHYRIKKDKWYKIRFEWRRTAWFYTSFSYAVECRAQFYRDNQVQFEFEDMLETGDNRSFLAGFKYCV